MDSILEKKYRKGTCKTLKLRDRLGESSCLRDRRTYESLSICSEFPDTRRIVDFAMVHGKRESRPSPTAPAVLFVEKVLTQEIHMKEKELQSSASQDCIVQCWMSHCMQGRGIC